MAMARARGRRVSFSRASEKATVKTRLYKSKKSQAIRLPKDVAFPPHVREVTIVREGNRRIIAPADSSWDDFFGAAGTVLEGRVQATVQLRDEL